MNKATKVAMDKEEAEWRAEDDLRTLIQAEEIRADRARLKRAMAKRKEKIANLQKLDKAD